MGTLLNILLTATIFFNVNTVVHARPLLNSTQSYPPDCRFVQLHVHLDGSIRYSTIFDLAARKGIPLKQKSVEELSEYLKGNISAPGVDNFFKAFDIILPVIKGDREAIYQITMEFIEDAAKQKLCYTEIRFSSYFLTGPNFGTDDILSEDEVIEIVLQASYDGQRIYGVKSNIILCAIRQFPNETANVVELALKYKNKGVVGIDIAGAEDENEVTKGTSKILIEAFKRARELGIPYTIHGGEDHLHRTHLISDAIEILKTKRLGHGYAVVYNESLYQQLKTDKVHVEVCPMSSFLTGAVSVAQVHPLARFANDNVNFSISTDDTTVTNTTIPHEIIIAQNIIGLSERQVITAQFNAAEASFLPDTEKKELINHLRKVYTNFTLY